MILTYSPEKICCSLSHTLFQPEGQCVASTGCVASLICMEPLGCTGVSKHRNLYERVGVINFEADMTAMWALFVGETLTTDFMQIRWNRDETCLVSPKLRTAYAVAASHQNARDAGKQVSPRLVF